MMSSTAPPGAPLGATSSEAASASLSWEGDKMFNIYIYDYCFKRGFRKTARELLVEAEIPPDSTPPINARQGLLFEWWSVFWVLFTAKANGQGPEDAMIYTQHQAAQAAARQRQAQGGGGAGQQQQQPGQQPGSQQIRPPMNVNGMNQPRFSNGPIPNGIPTAGFPTGPQLNGIPPSQGFQQMMPGQRPPPPMGVGVPPQQRGGPANGGGPPFQSPSIDPSQPPPPNPQQGHQQQSMNRMLPPNGMPPQPGQTPGSFPIARPPSRAGTPNAMLSQSPSLMNRQTPMMGTADIHVEFTKIPPQILVQIRQEMGLDNKDPAALTLDEKSRLLSGYRQRMRSQKPGMPNAVAGPSNPMMPPQRTTSGRPTKRNSSSPGNEQEITATGSSPKRARRSPLEQPPPIPQMPSYPQQQQAPPPQPGGPQHMNGPMMRMPGPPPPQNGFNPGMPQMMNPMMSMGQPPPPPPLGGPLGGMNPAIGGLPNQGGMMNPQMQMHSLQNRGDAQYRPPPMQAMHVARGMMPQGGMVPNANSPAAGDGAFNPGGPPPGGPQFNPSAPPPAPGPPPNSRLGAPPPPQGPQKPMMLPPQSPGMPKDQQSQQPQPGSVGPPGNKDIKAEGSPHNNIADSSLAPNNPNNNNPSSTAPPTPVTSTNPTTLDTSSLFLGTGDMLSTDFISSVATSLDDFDPSMFRPDGDINFERDFGQWFNPDDAFSTALDMPK